MQFWQHCWKSFDNNHSKCEFCHRISVVNKRNFSKLSSGHVELSFSNKVEKILPTPELFSIEFRKYLHQEFFLEKNFCQKFLLDSQKANWKEKASCRKNAKVRDIYAQNLKVVIGRTFIIPKVFFPQNFTGHMERKIDELVQLFCLRPNFLARSTKRIRKSFSLKKQFSKKFSPDMSNTVKKTMQ